ncbi:hypothetical protein BC831DRAFT_552683, partial [Entophlyctis helioformis]
ACPPCQHHPGRFVVAVVAVVLQRLVARRLSLVQHGIVVIVVVLVVVVVQGSHQDKRQAHVHRELVRGPRLSYPYSTLTYPTNERIVHACLPPHALVHSVAVCVLLSVHDQS